MKRKHDVLTKNFFEVAKNEMQIEIAKKEEMVEDEELNFDLILNDDMLDFDDVLNLLQQFYPIECKFSENFLSCTIAENSSIKNITKALTKLLFSGKCPQELMIYAGGQAFLFDGELMDKDDVDLMAIGDEGAIKIAKALSSGNCPDGLYLCLEYNNIRAIGAKALAEALSSGNCPRGLTIVLSKNIIGDEGAIEIAKALSSGNSPQGLTIDLEGNNISDIGVKALAKALSSGNCPRGLTVNLGGKKIGDEGVKEIAKALSRKNCPQGLTINLFGTNNISDEGLKALAQAFSKNCTIKSFALLNKNGFSKKSINFLLQCLSYNYSLTELNIGDLDEEQQEVLDSLLKRNQTNNLITSSNNLFFKFDENKYNEEGSSFDFNFLYL